MQQRVLDDAVVAAVVDDIAGRSAGAFISTPAARPPATADHPTPMQRDHAVTIFEKSDRIGGLMRYGIPEYKLEKATLNQRLAQMSAEGTRFVTDCEVGVHLTVEQLRAGRVAGHRERRPARPLPA